MSTGLGIATVKDYFVDRVLTGASVTAAMQNALLAALQFARETERSGTELATLLRELGIEDLIGKGNISARIADVQERAFTMWVQPTTGGVGAVPLPGCIERHLPKGRQPTKEEIEAAWDQCTGNTSK